MEKFHVNLGYLGSEAKPDEVGFISNKIIRGDLKAQHQSGFMVTIPISLQLPPSLSFPYTSNTYPKNFYFKQFDTTLDGKCQKIAVVLMKLKK